MAAKTDSSKLSPPERLARKRAAARLRQQRCRARKRQAMLEKKRIESERGCGAVVTVKVTHDCATASANNRRIQPQGPSSTYSKTIVDPYSSNNKKSAVVGGVPSQNSASTSGESIYNCVSFESQRSFEEAQKSYNNKGTAVSPSSSPSRTSIMRVPSEESNKQLNLNEPLIAEEQAAIAAMLSLKTGSEKPVVSATTSRDGGDEREQPPPSSPTLPPKEVRIPMESVSDVPTTATTTPTKYVASRGYPQHHLPPPPSQHLRHPPTHHQRLTIVATEPHYEVYEYHHGHHPSLPPPRGLPPPPRRVTPTSNNNGGGYYRPSPTVGAPLPPSPLHYHPHHAHHHPSHYTTSSRGFYSSPPRGYTTVRYE